MYRCQIPGYFEKREEVGKKIIFGSEKLILPVSRIQGRNTLKN
jgi:hypothetical protein